MEAAYESNGGAEERGCPPLDSTWMLSRESRVQAEGLPPVRTTGRSWKALQPDRSSARLGCGYAVRYG